MTWLLTKIFGMCEGSAIVRAPHCWIAVIGCISIAVLFYAGFEHDKSGGEKRRRIHSKPKHTVQK